MQRAGLFIAAMIWGTAAIADTTTHITIRDDQGRLIYSTRVAKTAEKPPLTGENERYTVTLSRNGYIMQRLPLEHRSAGWFLAGRPLGEQLAGTFIVDGVSGALYHLATSRSPNGAEGIEIVLLEALGPGERGALTDQ